MAKFFKSSNDLLNWIRTQNNTASEASDKLLSVIGSSKHEQDIVESTRRIFEDRNADHAAEVIFNLLSQHDITESDIKTASEKIGEIYAADELLKEKLINAEQHKALTKQAQIMRQPGQYPMELRVCPKLPASVGNRRISTYNCIHYCLDSLCLDDEPNRVYCMEALWRKHIADKMHREARDPKTGQLFGGYIANRFYTFPSAGTPANPDVPRDGGNPMALKPGERSRQARPHEWSTERRLQEQREKGSTESLTLGKIASNQQFRGEIAAALLSHAKSSGFVKIATVESIPDEITYRVFNEAIELENMGIEAEAAIVKLVQSSGMSFEDVTRIREAAIKKMSSHASDVYLMKTAFIPEPSALQQESYGGTYQAGEDIVLDRNAGTIPTGTILIKDPNNTKSLTFVRQDTNQPVVLNQQQADSLIDLRDVSHLMNGDETPVAQPQASQLPLG